MLAPAVGTESRALDGCELRELHAAATVLESLAVKQGPPFGLAAIERLREANRSLRLAAGDPAAVAKAEQDFHRELTARCGNARLLAVLARDPPGAGWATGEVGGGARSDLAVRRATRRDHPRA